MQKRMVVFDFDGVIVDSWWLTHKTSKKAFPRLTEDEHRKGFEGNIYDSDEKWSHLEKVDIDYFGEYEKEMHLVQFFEQMEDVVRELAQRHLLSIVSSTTSQVIRQYLEREGIDEHFSDILGADIHTRKHIKIGMLFDKHGLAPKDCVMITDTTGDMKEASQVGVSSIGVVWGFHARETLESMQPYALAEVPADIPRLVDEYFAR